MLGFREYCSGMMFNVNPKIHPFFTFDAIEEPLDKEQNIAKYLITEPVFLEAVREVADNCAYDQVILIPTIVAYIIVLRTTTKKRQSFCKKSSFSSFCRRFRRFVIVFFVFISFRRLSSLLSVRNDPFFVVFCRFLRRCFQMKWLLCSCSAAGNALGVQGSNPSVEHVFCRFFRNDKKDNDFLHKNNDEITNKTTITM